jgi:hypothetical protein
VISDQWQLAVAEGEEVSREQSQLAVAGMEKK